MDHQINNIIWTHTKYVSFLWFFLYSRVTLCVAVNSWKYVPRRHSPVSSATSPSQKGQLLWMKWKPVWNKFFCVMIKIINYKNYRPQNPFHFLIGDIKTIRYYYYYAAHSYFTGSCLKDKKVLLLHKKYEMKELHWGVVDSETSRIFVGWNDQKKSGIKSFLFKAKCYKTQHSFVLRFVQFPIKPVNQCSDTIIMQYLLTQTLSLEKLCKNVQSSTKTFVMWLVFLKKLLTFLDCICTHQTLLSVFVST